MAEPKCELAPRYAGKPLTAADREALHDLPEPEWFDVAHAPIARPSYRCERLEAAGLLERRVVVLNFVDGRVTTRTEYRRHPDGGRIAQDGADHPSGPP